MTKNQERKNSEEKQNYQGGTEGTSFVRKSTNEIKNNNYSNKSDKSNNINMNKMKDGKLENETKTKVENRISNNHVQNKIESKMTYEKNRSDNKNKKELFKDSRKNSWKAIYTSTKERNYNNDNNNNSNNNTMDYVIEAPKNKSFHKDNFSEKFKTNRSLFTHNNKNDEHHIKNYDRNNKNIDRNYYRSNHRSDERNIRNGDRINSRNSNSNTDQTNNRNIDRNRNFNKHASTVYTTSRSRNTDSRNHFNHSNYNRRYENRQFNGTKPFRKHPRSNSNEKRENIISEQSDDHIIEKKVEISEKVVPEIEEKKKEKIELTNDEKKEETDMVVSCIKENNNNNNNNKEEELIREEEKKKKREEERKKVMSWKTEEQELLEEALKLYRSLPNTPEKWEKISQVVKTRNSEECLKRFHYCRSIVLKEQQKLKKEVEELREKERIKEEEMKKEKEKEREEMKNEKEEIKHEQEEEEQDIDSDDMNINNNKNIKGKTLLLDNVEIKNISMYKAISLKLLLVCTRCVNTFEIIATSKNNEIICNCSNCNNGVVVEVYRNICFLENSCICIFKFNQCSLMDLLTADYSVNCDSCGRKTLLKNVTSGKEMNVNCQKCYTKLTFKYKDILFDETVNINDATIKKIDDMINKLFSKATMKKKNAVNLIKNNVKIEKTKNIMKINNIEVTNGACKHFKRSYRLFKFPCCNKVFPCPTCHDDKSNHKHQNAKIFICGFCYREFSDNSVCMCQNDKKIKKGGKFWEGGKGCRNPITLSRNDPKKYKLLNRQTVQKKK